MAGKRHDLGGGDAPRLRQFQKRLTEEGHLLTISPASGDHKYEDLATSVSPIKQVLIALIGTGVSLPQTLR